MSNTYNYPFPSTLQAVQLLTFLDPLGNLPSFQINLNPTVIKHKPSTLRKYAVSTNGKSLVLGSNEAPPLELAISWNMLDATQLAGIQPFENISPVVVVLNNDDAYLGVLTFNNVEQLNGYTRKVYAVDCSFLVLSPYNGLSTTLNTLTPPTITATSQGANTGYIQNPSTIYLWSTVFSSVSALAESTVGSVTTISNATANNSYALSWTPPASTYFDKLRIYWNSTNNPTTATLLTEVESGFPQGNSSTFTLYNSYVQYNSIVPKTYGLAFTGYWSGGLWVQAT